MKLLFLLLLIALLPFNTFADVDDDTQAWSIFRYTGDINSFRLGAQLQLRYTFDGEKLYEEQINPSIHYVNDYGTFGFIFTLGTNDGFETRKEYRYALEYEFSAVVTSDFVYEIRFRQELRDFKGVSEPAHRFRVLNEIIFIEANFKEFYPFISSEFNFYLNDFNEADRIETGISSHRTIVGIVKSYEKYSLVISYIHDYGVFVGRDRVRHVLSGTFIF